MTATKAEEILGQYATNKGSWAGWEQHHIDFRVGPATAELHSAHDCFRTLYSVRVKAKKRGQGHGRRLMDVIVAYAEATGCGLRLEVYADNEPAVRLYKAVGFRITNTRDGIHVMRRYPSRIPSTPEWDEHFEKKALLLERDHEPRLGSDHWVGALDALHRAREVAYAQTKNGQDGRVRYSGSRNYEENTRRLYCDAIGAALEASGWTITRINEEEA